MMVETAVHDQKVGFSDFAENLDEVRTSLTEVVRQLPIDTETTATILLSIENNIKTLLKNLADKTEIGWGIDTDPEDFSHLPNSITGVIIYYVTKGIREDFGYEFETEPKSLKIRGLSKNAKKIAGKKRLLTRDQKNELIAQTEMSYYKDKISSGVITLEDAMSSIKRAYEEMQKYEEIGYMLPAKKADYPYWIKADLVQ
jgi:hypothetical protein